MLNQMQTSYRSLSMMLFEILFPVVALSLIGSVEFFKFLLWAEIAWTSWLLGKQKAQWKVSRIVIFFLIREPKACCKV